MEITLGQQYNVEKKPTVILYITLIAMQGHQKIVKTKQRQCSTPSHMVIVIYYYIGYKYKATQNSISRPTRERNGTHRRRKVDEKSCVTFLLCDPGWYVQRT